MNRETGGTISLLDHIRQSIGDILTTPIGSRIMRREYGSQLPELIDQPFNNTTRLLAYAAITVALMRWEARIRLSRVQLSGASLSGQVELLIEGSLVDSNEPFNLQVPITMGASI